MCRRQSLLVVLLAILAQPVPTMSASADFQDGLQSYYRMSFSRALSVWRPLAEDGDPKAQYQLGVMYYRGEGVRQSYDEAAEWYRRAAEGGDADAQFNLGLMYANGIGLDRDYVSAHVWFTLAASTYAHRQRETWAIADPHWAARNRDWAASKLSTEQLATARRRISALRSRLPG